MNIKIRVNNLTKKWGTREPLQLCKYLKIIIIYRDLGNIKGYYTKCLRRKFIIINSELDDFSKKIVLAHELGHAMLHGKDILFMKTYFTSHKSTLYENEANLFAKCLLENNEEFYKVKSRIDHEVMECIFNKNL